MLPWSIQSVWCFQMVNLLGAFREYLIGLLALAWAMGL